MREFLDELFSAALPWAGRSSERGVWIHADAVSPALRAELRALAAVDHEVAPEDLVIEIDRRHHRLAQLHYPHFFTVAHPALCCSLLVDVMSGTITARSFAGNANRPILHRKELLISPDHPEYEMFASLTAEEERLGLLSNERTIGWSREWEAMLAQRGLTVAGHTISCRRR